MNRWRDVAPGTVWAWVRRMRHHRCIGANCCGRRTVIGAGRTQAEIATEVDQVLTWMQTGIDLAFAPLEMVGQKVAQGQRELMNLQAEALRLGAGELADAIKVLSGAAGQAVQNVVAPVADEAQDLLLVPLLLVGGLIGVTVLSGGGQAALAALPAVAPGLLRAARPL